MKSHFKMIHYLETQKFKAHFSRKRFSLKKTQNRTAVTLEMQNMYIKRESNLF